MIKTFACGDTQRLFSRDRVRRFQSIETTALIKLNMLNAATTLNDLLIPPGNRLDSLKGDRTGQHSIRINQQWRICFVWSDGNAYSVEIVDYH